MQIIDNVLKHILSSNATNKNVIWNSSDPSIATIDSKGKITAKKIGTTIITATASNGNKTTCRVTVVDTISLNEIKLEKETLTIKEKSTEQLNIIFNPSNATNKKVTWKSSNENVAKVSDDGEIIPNEEIKEEIKEECVCPEQEIIDCGGAAIIEPNEDEKVIIDGNTYYEESSFVYSFIAFPKYS